MRAGKRRMCFEQALEVIEESPPGEQPNGLPLGKPVAVARLLRLKANLGGQIRLLQRTLEALGVSKALAQALFRP
mgnify:CR=1 FL=1